MNHLLREVTTPHSRILKVEIPEEFVEQRVEVLVFPVGQEQDDAEVQAFSDHSASTIDEWKDASEDLVWR